MSRAPYLKRRVQGKKTYAYRACPYSTEDATNRIPADEKTIHTTTSGRMSLEIRNGHEGLGFVCMDDNCPFYTGTAVTEVYMSISKTTIDQATGEYLIDVTTTPIPICSGQRFWET